MHIIKLTNPSSKTSTLKIIISPLSETKSESFTILFYGNLLTPHMGYIQMAVTVAVVTQNMCMSRRWKYELVAYVSHKQPSPSFTLLCP
jgi:hypothetical protein